MRTRFGSIFAMLIAGTVLFIACGGGSTAPVIQESYKGALSEGDFLNVDLDTKASTLGVTVLEGKYKGKTFDFKTKHRPELGKYLYTAQIDGQDGPGFLAIPGRLFLTAIKTEDGKTQFVSAVPDTAEVSFETLSASGKNVYNFVTLPAAGGADYGTFQILDTSVNKPSNEEGRDAQFLQKNNILTDTTNTKLDLFIRKKGKTFEALMKDSSNEFTKKLANLIPRVEKDGKVFFVIDFAQKSGYEGIGFAITQTASLETAPLLDGNYDFINGEGEPAKGTVSGGNTFTGAHSSATFEINKPWSGMVQYSTHIKANPEDDEETNPEEKTLVAIGFPVNQNEFYGISLEDFKSNDDGTKTLNYDGFIGIKAD